ncbi:unnamed protein product [Boreogadus saida]
MNGPGTAGTMTAAQATPAAQQGNHGHHGPGNTVTAKTDRYTAASITVGIAQFLLEHSGFVNSEAMDQLTDETTSGTGRKGSHPYLPLDCVGFSDVPGISTTRLLVGVISAMVLKELGERNFGFDSLKSRMNRDMEEKGIVARDCLPLVPRRCCPCGGAPAGDSPP